MRILKGILYTSVAAMWCTEFYAAEGIQVGMQGGYTTLRGKVTRKVILPGAGGPHNPERTNTSAHGISGGLHLGYGINVGHGYVGVEVDGNYSDVLLKERTPIYSYTGKLRHNYNTSGCLILGADIKDVALIYVKGGAVYGGFRYGSAYSTQRPQASISKKFSSWGAQGGVGVRVKLNSALDVGFEYTISRYETKKFVQPNIAQTSVTPQIDNFAIRLTYSFGSKTAPVEKTKKK